jgi:threonine/homoserine/homoserine lactone efflux protein
MSSETYGWLLSVLAFAVSMSATPGPNNAMVASSGATFGFLRTLPHLLGVAIGFPAMIVAIAFGAGDLMRTAHHLHDVLRWVGAAYLAWLAFKIATDRPSAEHDKDTEARDLPKNRRQPLTFLQAALFQWLNPKAWIIAIGAVTTYTTAGGVFIQALLLATVFLIVIVPTLSFWTLTGVGAAHVLQSDRALRAFNMAMAALLLASLLPLLLEG